MISQRLETMPSPSLDKQLNTIEDILTVAIISLSHLSKHGITVGLKWDVLFIPQVGSAKCADLLIC